MPETATVLEPPIPPEINGHNHSHLQENEPVVLQQPEDCPLTDEARLKSTTVSKSIRNTLYQATKLKDLTFETAMGMCEPFESDESADRARSRAMAVTSLVKAWEAACERIRIVRKIPMPGAMKHLPEQPKTRKKAKPMNKPPVIPGPV